MKDHLNAVIAALEAWRDSLPPAAPAPVIEPEPPAPAPVAKPKKTEAEIAEEVAARLAHFRFWQRKGFYLDMKQRCKVRVSDINAAAGRPSLVDVSWGGRYTPSQWIADKQKATQAEVELCGFKGARYE
jgi:hypothetical protein